MRQRPRRRCRSVVAHIPRLSLRLTFVRGTPDQTILSAHPRARATPVHACKVQSACPGATRPRSLGELIAHSPSVSAFLSISRVETRGLRSAAGGRKHRNTPFRFLSSAGAPAHSVIHCLSHSSPRATMRDLHISETICEDLELGMGIFFVLSLLTTSPTYGVLSRAPISCASESP